MSLSRFTGRQAIQLDMRLDATLRKSLEPANGSWLLGSWIIFKNQILYTFLQGFLWAIARDWYQVAAAAARIQGHLFGQRFNTWLSSMWRVFGVPVLASQPEL